MRPLYLAAVAILFVMSASITQARVHKNVKVGQFDTVLDLGEFTGKTFLKFMIEDAFPAFTKESQNGLTRKLDGVKKGDGVEIKLAPGITTYHIGYKKFDADKAERSGRSYSAVGFGRRVAYVADASYKHYLDSLEAVVKSKTSDMILYYEAIMKVIVNSDPSGLNRLNLKAQKVATDFIAVYIAEQYRHLVSGKGVKLGKRHNWDDALLQVTLVSALHGGQSRNERYMVFESKFTNKVYDNFDCVYKDYNNSKRDGLKKRNMMLRDYWQFNSKCDRSGVNITRRDFQKLGSKIAGIRSEWHGNVIAGLGQNPKYAKKSTVSTISSFLVSNYAPDKFENPDQIVDTVVNYVAMLKDDARDITDALK